MHEIDLLSNIGLSIVAATFFALLARALKQPLILAYLAAGIVVGPKIGFGLIQDEASITLISEIGLILLLFIIGLEIDLRKLLSAGRTLIVSGLSQFLICAALGIGFFFPHRLRLARRPIRCALSCRSDGIEQHDDRCKDPL